MAERTEVFTATEWTTLRSQNPNTSFYQVSPIEISGLTGYAPQTAGLVKFSIPDTLKARRIKDISLEFPYNILYYPVGGQTGAGSVGIEIAAAGHYKGLKILDVKTITWNIYKQNYYVSLGESIGAQGRGFPVMTLSEFSNGKVGTARKVIWSQDIVSQYPTYYDAVYDLFRYDCIVLSIWGGSAKISPSQMKLIITSEDPSGSFPVKLTIPSKNVFLNKTRENSFYWSVGDMEYVFTPMKQSGATFYWKADGESAWNTVEIPSAQMSCTIPANTFPTAKITWKVSVVSEIGTSASSAEQSFTTVDSLSAPKIISPKSIVIDNNKDAVFKWEHIIATGTEQTKAELEYSSEVGEWNALKTVEGNIHETVIAAGTLLAGRLLWRVRTYNMDGVAGGWSETEEIVSRGSSPAPAPVHANTSPRVEVKWQSEGQISAEVRLGDTVYKVYGNVKNFRSPVYLPDGELEVAVRVLNEFSLWSDWGTTVTVIKNEMLEQLKISAEVQNYGVVLSWALNGVSAYIYRDGELIGKTRTMSYTDYESIGEHRYSVLVGSSTGSYAQSNEVVVNVQVPAALLSAKDSGDWIVLEKRRGNFPMHKINTNMKTTYQFYAGRKLPVAYSPDNLTRRHTFDFSTKSRAVAERVAALAGEEVVYKDCRGDIAIGVIDKVTQQTDNVSDINFQITEISKGVVVYD